MRDCSVSEPGEILAEVLGDAALSKLQPTVTPDVIGDEVGWVALGTLRESCVIVCVSTKDKKHSSRDYGRVEIAPRRTRWQATPAEQFVPNMTSWATTETPYHILEMGSNEYNMLEMAVLVLTGT